MNKFDFKCERDSESRVVINMTVKDDSNFLSVFSHNSDPVISSDVAEFIENGADPFHHNECLALRIHSDCIDEEEKKIYDSAIRNYYREKEIANTRSIKRNNAIVFILLFLGIAVLGFSIFLENALSSAVWPEIVDIFAWVLVWESADIGIFKNNELRIKRKRYYSFINMRIEYCGLSEHSFNAA